jgi:hypothetical protein
MSVEFHLLSLEKTVRLNLSQLIKIFILGTHIFSTGVHALLTPFLFLLILIITAIEKNSDSFLPMITVMGPLYDQ